MMSRTDVRGGDTLRTQVLQVLQVLHALFMRVVEGRKKNKCYKSVTSSVTQASLQNKQHP